MRRVALAGALLAGLVMATALAAYEMTPTPILGHPDPHAQGAAALAEDVLSQSDALIAHLPGSISPAPAAAPAPPAEVVQDTPRTGVWIEMPALSIALPVQQGDGSDRIPMWKALVYPGTAWPGTQGTSYVYAHAYWGMFGGLLYARTGDVAYIHDYATGRVTEMRVSRVVGRVPYYDTSWVGQKSATRALTLQTCVDYNPKGDRFIVQLR